MVNEEVKQTVESGGSTLNDGLGELYLTDEMSKIDVMSPREFRRHKKILEAEIYEISRHLAFKERCLERLLDLDIEIKARTDEVKEIKSQLRAIRRKKTSQPVVA